MRWLTVLWRKMMMFEVIAAGLRIGRTTLGGGRKFCATERYDPRDPVWCVLVPVCALLALIRAGEGQGIGEPHSTYGRVRRSGDWRCGARQVGSHRCSG
jgi:hypothetical protein